MKSLESNGFKSSIFSPTPTSLTGRVKSLAIAKTIDYPIDKDMLSELIDNLVALSKKVNIEKK